MEFAIAIQELEVRLAARMTEGELLDVLRRNMLPHVQDRLLFDPIASVRELQNRVLQVEELAQRQQEVQQIRRPAARVHEIAALPLPISAPSHFSSSLTNDGIKSHPMPHDPSVAPVDAFITPNQSDEQQDWVCAMMASHVERNTVPICWNCSEKCHTFIECKGDRTVFCYGCGTKNVYRPNCQKCSLKTLQGNGRRNVRPMETRPEGLTFQQNSQHQRPN